MRNRLKKVRGLVPHIDTESYDDDGIHSPFLAALANPDLLSDEESRMFPERDFDDEQARVEYIEKFKQALTKLTPKQKAVLDAMSRHGNQLGACKELKIAQPTLSLTLTQIQKKITKYINKLQKGQ